MIDMMGRERLKRDLGGAVSPPPSLGHLQLVGKQWLYRRFKNCSPMIFKGSMDA